MSQNPLMHLGGQFSKTPSLKPPLAAALASLEVQLDRELARYRRTRTGGYRASNQAGIGASNASIGLQYLTPVTTTALDADSKSAEEKNSEISISEASTNTPLTYTNELTTPPPPPPPSASLSSIAVTPDPIKETPTTPPPPPPPRQSGANIVPVTTVKTEPSQNITDDSPKNQPDDYLESSEALLRSLTEEAPKAQKRPASNNNSLLSPLGIGSILLFVMSGLILGYAVINPKGLPQFNLGALFKPDSSPANNIDAISEINNANTKTVAQPQLTPIPRYPNLAKDEFPEVNSPNDIVGFKPKPKPTPSVAPTPTAPVQNSQSGINVVEPVEQAAVPASPAPVAITPSPTPTQPVPISDLKPSADGFYHVVIDNSNASAFANARKAVPDAYLSPDGKLIYLGAIKNKEKAQELLSEIQAKGLNARIK